MESNLPKVKIKTSLLSSHKSISPICPLSWLVSSVLNSCLHGTEFTVYSVNCKQYTMYHTDQSSVQMKQAKREDIWKKLIFGLGFSNIITQTNKLYIHYRVHCTRYTMYHTDQSSVHQKQTKREEIWQKNFCDELASWV